MKFPHCKSKKTTERSDRTELGYRQYRCRNCKRQFNEITGTPFNRLQLPTDVVFLIVLWRLRYKLSLRDLAEMFLERGFVFTHEAVREWERLIAPKWQWSEGTWSRRCVFMANWKQEELFEHSNKAV